VFSSTLILQTHLILKQNLRIKRFVFALRLTAFINPFKIFLTLTFVVFMFTNIRLETVSTFLSNNNRDAYETVNFRNQRYNIHLWSISILPDCKNTAYNTARVRKIVFLFLSYFSKRI
jgi:hypothetical protein